MAEREVKQWITVNGKHIPLFEGDSKQDAINRAIAKDNEETKERQIAKNRSEADENTLKPLVGITKSEEEDLQVAGMKQLVHDDLAFGTKVTSKAERKKYALGLGETPQFERKAYNIMQGISKKNNIDNNFVFDDARAQVRTLDGKYRILADVHAHARQDDERKWIVNEFDITSKDFKPPIKKQTRFTTPQDALSFVVLEVKKK